VTHPGREALRRMVETAKNLPMDWFYGRVQKGHSITHQDREHMCACDQTAVQQVAAYVAELEAQVAELRGVILSACGWFPSDLVDRRDAALARTAPKEPK